VNVPMKLLGAALAAASAMAAYLLGLAGCR